MKYGQDDPVFHPSTILEMDASLFDDYDEDYTATMRVLSSKTTKN